VRLAWRVRVIRAAMAVRVIMVMMIMPVVVMLLVVIVRRAVDRVGAALRGERSLNRPHLAAGRSEQGLQRRIAS
jgi:hypothetical protein